MLVFRQADSILTEQKSQVINNEWLASSRGLQWTSLALQTHTCMRAHTQTQPLACLWHTHTFIIRHVQAPKTEAVNGLIVKETTLTFKVMIRSQPSSFGAFQGFSVKFSPYLHVLICALQINQGDVCCWNINNICRYVWLFSSSHGLLLIPSSMTKHRLCHQSHALYAQSSHSAASVTFAPYCQKFSSNT